MVKKQLISVVATKAHLTRKAAQEAIETFLSEITKLLAKKEKVILSGFGTFRVTKVKDKAVIMPKTKQKEIIKGHFAPRFTPGKPLKKAVK